MHYLHRMTHKRGLVGFTTPLAGAALAVGTAAPAYAADPVLEPDGTVIIGDAQWYFDAYGFAYGWDAANHYDPSGYIFYPAEFYAGDYAYCGNLGPGQDGQATVDAGALDILCPAAPFAATGLTQQVAFRVYPEAGGGYLLRQVVTLTNETDTPIDVQGVLEVFYYDGPVYTGVQGTPGFLTSLGGDTVAADDTWYLSSVPDGSTVIETEAWARTGSAPGAGIVASSGPGLTFSDGHTQFAPGETKRFLTFTHMVIPATPDEAGYAAALDAALLQIPEFESFSGRLIAGLPPATEYIGWGVTPGLANTGAELDGAPVVVGAGALLLVAGVVLVARRRTVTD